MTRAVARPAMHALACTARMRGAQIVMLLVAFRLIGKILRSSSGDKGRLAMGWALGVAEADACNTGRGS